MKYFAIFEKNVEGIFQLQWKIEIFLTYFCNILCYVGNFQKWKIIPKNVFILLIEPTNTVKNFLFLFSARKKIP